MNTRLGKSFGLAFVVAVGILAVMFALGTFSAQKAAAAPTADGVTLSVDSHDPGGQVGITVTFDSAAGDPEDLQNNPADADIGPAGLLPPIALEGLTATATGNIGDTSVPLTIPAMVTGMTTGDASRLVTVAATAVINGGIVVTLPADTDDVAEGAQGIKRGGQKITVVIPASTFITVINPIVDATATVQDITSAVVDMRVHIESEDLTPGAAARITIAVQGPGADANGPGFDERIVVKMEDFGLPSSIDESDVTLRDDDQNESPDSVSVSGDTLTIVVGDMNGDDTPGTRPPLNVDYSIIFKERSGVTIPTAAGSYPVEVSHPDADAEGDLDFDVMSDGLNIDEILTLSSKDGARGKEVTLTGKGFDNVQKVFVDNSTVGDEANNGELDNNERILATDPTLKNNAFEITFVADDGFETGENTIVVLDTTDTSVEPADPAIFTVTPKISLSTDSAQPGDVITVTLEDFGIDLGIVEGRIGGGDYATLTGSDATTRDLTVPAGTTGGTKTVSIKAGGDTYTETITISGLPLTVEPTSAVPGQDITIRGSGFSPRATLDTIKIDGDGQPLQANGQSVKELLINNNGTFVVTVEIPLTVTSEGDSILVEVMESDGSVDDGTGNGRNGSVNMTIPEPTLTLNPTMSRTSTTVAASGTGFAAGENVAIKYTTLNGNPTTLTSVNADGRGNWSKAFTVPVSAGVGNENTVTAEGTSAAVKSMTADHETPGAAITVSPESGRPGITVTINGIDFRGYTAVSKVTIGGLTVPSAGVNTDKNGNFTMTALLPALGAGTHSLVAVVGTGTSSNQDSVVFTVGEAGPATLPSADAFADLTAANNLIVVWYFDNDTKGWSFYDPRPEVAAAVDLTMVTSGDNVWMQITANQMFQGEMLTAGWNSVTLR